MCWVTWPWAWSKNCHSFLPTGLRCCASCFLSLTLRGDTTAEAGKSNAGIWLECKSSPQVHVLSAWPPVGGTIPILCSLFASFSASCQPLPREAHPLLHNPSTMAFTMEFFPSRYTPDPLKVWAQTNPLLLKSSPAGHSYTQIFKTRGAEQFKSSSKWDPKYRFFVLTIHF